MDLFIIGIFLIVNVVLLSSGIIYFKKFAQSKDTRIEMLSRTIGELTEAKHEMIKLYEDTKGKLDETEVEVEHEVEKHKKILSQKKSSETRLGLISENIAPFLAGCPYDPRQMHFFGNPIDFIVFNYDEAEIIFLEVKSGNSKESARQKVIKNIIKSGKVHYEKMRINEKGVKISRETNEF